MKTENGVIEKIWTVVHKAQALLDGGWGDPVPHPHPPLRTLEGSGAPEGWMSLMARYGGQGAGCLTPRLLAVTGEKLLDPEELEYFGKWLAPLGLHPGSHVYFLTAPRSEEARKVLEELQRSFGAQVVFTLGEGSAQSVLGKRVSLPILRGQDYKMGGMTVLPTFHPRQVLQDQNLKKPVWEDLKRLKGILDYA